MVSLVAMKTLMKTFVYTEH